MNFQMILLCQFLSPRRDQSHDNILSLTRLNNIRYKYVLLHHNDASVLYNAIVVIVALLKTCAPLCGLRKTMLSQSLVESA